MPTQKEQMITQYLESLSVTSEPLRQDKDASLSHEMAANDILRNMDEYIEELASQVHDAWARGKVAKGYTWGEVTSDANKTHKDLVPYMYLTPEAQEYDKATARVALEGLVRIWRNKF